MDPVILACAVVLPVTALLYGMLGARRRRDRAVAAYCAGLRVDPYHAAAGRWWAEDDVQAAAARLLLDGLVTVNHRGNLRLTTAGADPARTAGHPLPDALLAALRRRTAPAALGNLVLRDPELRAVRAEFHAECGAVLRAGLPRPRRDAPCCLAVLGMTLLAMELTLATVALLDRMPHGPLQWTAAVVTGLALVAQVRWLDLDVRQREAAAAHPDPVAERLRQEELHPALAGLPAPTTRHLTASRLRTRRGRHHGRPRPTPPTSPAP
ncbi:hypothetical protein [Streptomyces sp. NPDC012888]|uniref:hypothetical protein n=1 Tax=Streptomyces sp. NPDC012888 TaxID=3364855 RepID=UPI0036B16E69